MANLKYLDRKLLEELFGMGGGYVLDFSDATYATFLRELGVDIYDKRYEINGGTSKAKRMRALWELGSDVTVGKVLVALFEYVDATNPQGAGGPVEDRHRAIAQRLLGLDPHRQKTEPLTEKQFLDVEFGTLDLGRLSLDAAMEFTVKQRLAEIRSCLFTSEAPLAAVLLSGSTLEGLLLNAATKSPEVFNRAHSAPKDGNGKTKQFHEWTLNDLIEAAFETGAIRLDVKKYSHALRDFRNYIHPYEQARSQFSPDVHTAKISWQVLRAAIADLSRKR